MDGHDGLSVHAVPLGYNTSKFHGQEKRDVLERKVSVPGEMGNDEEDMVQSNREWLLHQNSLPLKMREVMAELLTVEDEINRLENQIKAVEIETQKSKRTHNQSNSDKWQHPESSSKEEKGLPFEIKTLHFISKAIKGDYKFSDFRTSHKATNSMTFSNLKEKSVSFRQRFIKQRPQASVRNSGLEIPRDNGRKIMSTPSPSEEDTKWANKLSENIIKCLIFIFVRILRASETTDLEKSGLIIIHKNSPHQDPYGIFDTKDSIARDIGPYKNLIRFTSSSMDFICTHNTVFLPLFQRLKVLIDGLEKVDLRFLSHQQKLAFWINMHNACIMHGYLQFGLPSASSYEKMPKLIKQATLNIAGNIINARTIERFILKKPSHSVDKQIFHSKEMIIQQQFGLKTPEPNITFALCHGTRSSPQVKIYTAEGVRSELERSKVEYLQAAIMVKNTRRIALPELLLRNMHDFGQDVCPLMEWLCRQLPESSCLRKSIVECFRQLLQGGKISAAVEMIPYDFEFQYLFPISTN